MNPDQLCDLPDDECIDISSMYSDYNKFECKGKTTIKKGSAIRGVTFNDSTSDISGIPRKNGLYIIDKEDPEYDKMCSLYDRHYFPPSLKCYHFESYGWKKIDKPVVIEIIKRNFNLVMLRQILLDANESIELVSSFPLMIDGPLFDDVSVYISLVNVLLGPVAAKSYSNMLGRIRCEIAEITSNLMVMTGLEHIDVTAMIYKGCDLILPTFCESLEVLTISGAKHCDYKFINMPNLSYLMIEYIDESMKFTLDGLPALRRLKVIGKANFSISNSIFLNLNSLKVRDISFNSPMPNLDEYDGSITPEILGGIPNVTIIKCDTSVIEEYPELIPTSVKILRFRKGGTIGSMDKFVKGYKTLLELPNLEVFIYFDRLGLDANLLEKTNMIFNILQYKDGKFIQQGRYLSDKGRKIERHNDEVYKRSKALVSLT